MGEISFIIKRTREVLAGLDNFLERGWVRNWRDLGY
jgi:hypothetical protein